MRYCSIICYKSEKHLNCSETFYKEQIETELKSSQRKELSKDEKEHLTEIFKRASEFNEDDLQNEDDESDFLIRLSEMNLDDVEEEDLPEILGPELFRKFQDYVNSQFEPKAYTPWWAIDDRKVSEFFERPKILENLPSFRSISKSMPSEFLWNNLVDILFVYVYLMHVYSGDLDDLKGEFVESALDLSFILSNTGTSLNHVLTQVRVHDLIGNPDLFIAESVKSLAYLLKTPENVLRAFCHFHDIFNSISEPRRPILLAGKKLYYYCVWINSEIQDNPDLFDEIIASIILVVGGLHDSLPLSPRRSSKKILRFSLMVAGQSGLGKTTFLKTLFRDQIDAPFNKIEGHSIELPFKTEEIKSYNFEIEAEDGTRLLIEAIDTPGFDDDFPSKDRAKQLLNFIERAYDDVFEEEQRIHRNPKFEEHRIHALLYFMEPNGLGLKKVDEEFMKSLSGRINIIPIVAKADGLTGRELSEFQKRIYYDLQEKGISTFEFQRFESSDELTSNGLPFAVVGATFPIEKCAGRNYPWGFVDINDESFSDFNLLKQNILNHFRDDLKEATEDGLYEQYRTEKLLKLNTTGSKIIH